MGSDNSNKSDLSRVIILDLILVIAFSACIIITTLMYGNESNKAAQKYVSSSAFSLEHDLEIQDFEKWDLILTDFVNYYDMDATVFDKNGNITYLFVRGAINSSDAISETLKIGNTGYSVTVSAIPNEVTIIDNNTVSVSLNILLINVFIVIILIVTSFVQSYRNQIVRMATIDELTGISNRKSFIERYERLNTKGKLKNAAIFMIDVDKFKGINDTSGHASGDAALKYIGHRLKKLENSDMIAGRWGGDEFIGIIASENDDPVKLADNVLSNLMEDVRKAEIIKGFTISLSIGVAKVLDGTKINVNMERADEALYVSKNNGRGRLSIYDDLSDKKTDAIPESGSIASLADSSTDTCTAIDNVNKLINEESIAESDKADDANKDRFYDLHYEDTSLAHEDAKISQQILSGIIDGVNHMIPFALGGGVLIAIAFLTDAASIDISTLDVNELSSFGTITDFAASFKSLGDLTFNFMFTVFSAFLAMYLGGYEAFVAGFMGGYMAYSGGVGFIGAFFAGIAAGYSVKLMKNFVKELPDHFNTISSLIIYPVLSLLLINLMMYYIISPLSNICNSTLTEMLEAFSHLGKLPLSIIAGSMMGCDMGGPVNKAAYYFGTKALNNKEYDVMAFIMAAGMTPPCGIALSTFLFPNRFTKPERRRSGITFLMGLAFITEGAISYLLADVINVMISCMIGSGVSALLSEVFGCTLMAPHGGIFVFLIAGKPVLYFIAIMIGSLVTAIILGYMKKVKDMKVKNRLKLPGILMLIISLVMFTGCARTDNNTNNIQEEPGHYTFAYTCMDGSNPYFEVILEEITELVESRGDTLVVFDGQNDISKQQTQLEDMAYRKYDGVFLNPVDSEKVITPLKKINEASIPVVCFDAQVEDASYIDSYIGSDNYNAGKVVGEDLVKRVPDGGSIIILDSPATRSAKDRVEGFIDSIEGTGFDIYSMYDCGGDETRSYEATKKLLGLNSEITAIFAENDPTALGALKAVNELGYTDCIIYGVDGSPSIKQELAKDDSPVKGTGAQSPVSIARKAVEIMYSILDGENVEKTYTIDTYLITSENIGDYDIKSWQ
ncbi:PTS system, fructose subfamily, IIC component [Butyrivibrio fibrisolvens DSM 3071]|uniref:PTS system, fructose subfamily, IIC component n=1 Tax=Butyrivibrio fibrisolvens DSM 3071 TaxID=1121131 RepID=A0A1M5YNA4_BUTFI|nr:fructose-specific PTS transporter subunit EIIC [Butyrivibrio fibrisolvens]SHI13545.1 PTS system, fructose subfamily, IIC component [Butyrivibrio fibrisolvens DSM 3071]